LPSDRFAALLASRVRITAPPKDLLEVSLKLLCDQPYPVALWESVLLPARVVGYRTELLDTLLAQGNLFWHITPGLGLSFHRYEDIDWEFDLSAVLDTLGGNEKIIYDALLRRGASFMQRLSGLIETSSPYDTLIELTEKGLVCADSFFPIRQLLNKENLKKGSVRQRVTVRSKALTNGRWELSRPLKPLTIEQLLERAFDRSVIICRETVQGLPWGKALETLRVWEYTGRVRRGYYIEGLSGIQFIREKDFAGTMQELEQPRDEIIWLSAVDPAQPWGKILSHMQDKSFLNVVGTAVALRAGIPVAVFERQGKVLRVFDDTSLPEALRIFSNDYAKRRLFPMLNRLTVKEYPQVAVIALASAGFIRELQDYALYRSSI
jgi:ATP-dependent Lhr-like helicase